MACSSGVLARLEHGVQFGDVAEVGVGVGVAVGVAQGDVVAERWRVAGGDDLAVLHRDRR